MVKYVIKIYNEHAIEFNIMEVKCLSWKLKKNYLKIQTHKLTLPEIQNYINKVLILLVE